MAAYSDAIMSRFMHTQYAYKEMELDDSAQPFYYKVSVGAQEQGAMLSLFVRVDAQTEKIISAEFQMYGCGACIAVADVLCERLIGLNLGQLQSFNTQELAIELELPMVKMHCTWLASEALEKITIAWQSASASHS